jgi:SAM-dependent methyltransferase
VKNFRVRITGERLTDWQTYHNIVAEHLRPGMKVLEVGCGRGDVAPFPWRTFPDVELTGLDTDPAAGANPFLTCFVHLRAPGPWPLESETFDLVVCRYVLEHVDDPAMFLGNIQRVLKRGGSFISLTPNARHPQILVARLPLWLKSRILQATKGIRADQVFPTFYRLNSLPRIARFARRHGFEISVLLTKEFVPSNYLDFSFVGFLLSWAYFTTMVKTGWERYFGAQIIAVLRNGPLPTSKRPISALRKALSDCPSKVPAASFVDTLRGPALQCSNR